MDPKNVHQLRSGSFGHILQVKVIEGSKKSPLVFTVGTLWAAMKLTVCGSKDTCLGKVLTALGPRRPHMKDLLLIPRTRVRDGDCVLGVRV